MSIVICPNCKSLLQQHEKGMRCSNGHSFDAAKEGYVNLLLANQKKSNDPGDNKQMTNARDEFLSKGHFDFLLEDIDTIIDSLGVLAKTANLLDVGCGTGFYTRTLFKQYDLNRVGVDISKIGIAKAARQDKNSIYLVGSAFDLPLAENTIDILVNVFSPIDLAEVTRVLKPEGVLIKVIPSGDHMKEVADLVYDKFIPHQSSITSEIEAIPLFEVVKVENLLRATLLQEQDLVNFISMTPYLYKFSQSQLDMLTELTVTLSFQIIVAQYGE